MAETLDSQSYRLFFRWLFVGLISVNLLFFITTLYSSCLARGWLHVGILHLYQVSGIRTMRYTDCAIGPVFLTSSRCPLGNSCDQTTNIRRQCGVVIHSVASVCLSVPMGVNPQKKYRGPLHSLVFPSLGSRPLKSS